MGLAAIVSSYNLTSNDILLLTKHLYFQNCYYYNMDRLCGLMVSVEDYQHGGPGFDSRALLRIFLRELGLERGPLSLVIG
jgi:hypothetical protein